MGSINLAYSEEVSLQVPIRLSFQVLSSFLGKVKLENVLYECVLYFSIFVKIDICHLIDGLFHGSLFLLFSDLFMNFSSLDR